jgi:hypothetical protein
MAELSEAKREALQALLETAPDTLVAAVAIGLGEGAAAESAAALAWSEQRGRAAARAAFEPLLSEGPRWSPPCAALQHVWRALRRHTPDLAREIEAQVENAALEAPDLRLMDEACLVAADLVTREPSAFAGLEAQPDRLATALSLAPEVRRGVPRLSDWSSGRTDGASATARLAYRDASRLSPEAGPLFLSLLQSRLAEPDRILGVISCMMGRPSDRFVARSELADFGEMALAEAQAALDAVRSFDGGGGAPAARAAAASAHELSLRLERFEAAFDLARDGPWGGRVLGLRRGLAETVEARLKSAERCVAEVLPLQRQPGTPRSLRGVPRLDAPPPAHVVERAKGLVAFVSASATALDGGYGAARSRVAAELEARLGQEVDDLVERLHAREVDETAARARLGLAADLLGGLLDARAAQAVRRRAAAA